MIMAIQFSNLSTVYNFNSKIVQETCIMINKILKKYNATFLGVDPRCGAAILRIKNYRKFVSEITDLGLYDILLENIDYPRKGLNTKKKIKPVHSWLDKIVDIY